MVGDPKEHSRGGKSCEAVEGGYTIFLDGETIGSFMEAADYSSARELDHFREVGAQIEKRIRTGSGLSILALAEAGQGVTRDFVVLQVAHILAKHGRNVLVVDCDFLHSGLSGLVENVEEVGFLDLLLYGSSLKSIARGIGIDGVSVVGPGSFPVSRTVPFALKEFGKIKEFLSARHDVVIYCSTLHAEDGALNHLAGLVDGILLCCRIDEMAEGELQRDLKEFAEAHVPPVDLVCLCGKRDRAAERSPVSAPAAPEMRAPGAAARESEPPVTIEKTEEIETAPRRRGARVSSRKRGSRVNLPRIITVSVAVLLVAFFVWWTLINQAAKRREQRGTIAELSGKQPGRSPQSTEGLPPGDTAGRDTAAVAPGGVPARAESTQTPSATPSEERVGSPGEGAGTRTGPGEAVTSETKPAVPTATPAETAEGRFTVHVASFKDSELSRANVEKAYLEQNGYTVVFAKVEIRGEQWLRVLAGAYGTEQEADAARLALLALPRIGYARVMTFERANMPR